MHQRLKVWLGRPVVLIVACWALLNLPLLLGIRVIPGDTLNEFYPMVHFNVHSIREGLAPWWNPYIYAGYPQVADPQAMLFSPAFMAWMLLNPDPGTTWFVWGLLLNVCLGGWAFAVFAQKQGASKAGAVVGALVFMAGGVAASRMQHAPIVPAYSFIVVALLMARHFVERPGWRRGLMLGAAGAAILVQPVQLTYLAGALLAVYLLALVLRRFSGWSRKERWRAARGLCAAAATCLLLALPQLAFTYAFVLVSNRPELALKDALDHSMDLRTLLTFVLPNALQGLRGTYDGPVEAIEAFFYIGALPSLLLVAGLPSSWRHAASRRHLLFWAAVAVASIVYMLGGNTPVYAWLYAHVPGISLFRRPADSAYLLNLALAVMTSVAISRLDLSDTRLQRRLFGGAFVWLLLASLQMQGDGADWQAASIIAAFLSLAVFLLAERRRSPSWVLACLCLVTVADYRCFNLNGEFNQWRDTARRLRADPAALTLARLTQGASGADLSPRIEATGQGGAWKNMVGLLGLSSTQGYSPLRWELYERWYRPHPELGNGARPGTAFNRDPTSVLNALLGVTFIVQPSDAAPMQGADVIYDDGRNAISVFPQALPRWLTPREARVIASPGALSPDAFASNDFRSTVLLTPRDAGDRRGALVDASRCVSGTTVGAATATNVQVDVRTDGAADGWLVLGDLDFPGWVASIDGVEVPFHRANGMFRALCVPAGAHAVRFRFSPVRMLASVVPNPDAWR